MARMTKKLINDIWQWTNECYKKALLDEYPNVFKHVHISNTSDFDMKMLLIELEQPIHSENINKRYLDYLRKLSSHQLNLVIEADKKKKIRRSPITIHALLDELFERSANSDSKDKA